MEYKKIEGENCCASARNNHKGAMNTMGVFQWGPMYNAARKTADEAQAHLTACAKPRRMALAARIISKAGA